MKLFARLLLVVALLFAQAGGVAHEIWHAASLTPDGDGDAKTPKGNSLCDFHTALSAVLGAIAGGSHAAPLDAQAALSFLAADLPARSFSGLAPRSRGPPALL